MKKSLLIIVAICITGNCFSQVHKKKYVAKKKVNYCKLPIDFLSDSSIIGFSGGDGYTTYIIHGVTCIDSTGMAEYYRRKKIGDTTYFMPHYDTARVILLTQVDNIKLHTEALKVIDNGEWYTSDLYEDTLTKKHFLGNFGSVSV